MFWVGGNLEMDDERFLWSNMAIIYMFIANVISEEASSFSSTRVSGEFMMQDSLLNSLKQEGDGIVQQSNEVPTMDTVLESLAVMFNSKDSKKEDHV